MKTLDDYCLERRISFKNVNNRGALSQPRHLLFSAKLHPWWDYEPWSCVARAVAKLHPAGRRKTRYSDQPTSSDDRKLSIKTKPLFSKNCLTYVVERKQGK